MYYRLMKLAFYIIPTSINKERIQVAKRATDKVNRRLAKSEDRKDFFSFILKATEEKGMSTAELHSSATVFIIGGSETTYVISGYSVQC